MKRTAPVNRIIEFSNVDGPGNRTSIFVQSCPFRCLYCHNPETITMCISCGDCLPRCPQSIQIPGQLRRIARYVEDLKQDLL